MDFANASKDRTLSVVLPAFNEAAVLEPTVEGLAAWLNGGTRPFEIILVDDGSTDETPRIIDRLAARMSFVQRLGWTGNRGRGAALRAGLQQAKGSIVLTTEADLSWGVPTLEELCCAIESGRADVAIASPHRPPGGFANVPPSRRLLSRAANALAGSVLGHSITMATGMTRAYRQSILPQIMSPHDGKAFHLDTLCRAIRSGLRLTEVPAVVRWPSGRSSQRPRLRAAKLMAQILDHIAVLGEHLWRSRMYRALRA